jgi:hypothetical protein
MALLSDDNALPVEGTDSGSSVAPTVDGDDCAAISLNFLAQNVEQSTFTFHFDFRTPIQ